jgi:hypothetical protein
MYDDKKWTESENLFQMTFERTIVRVFLCVFVLGAGTLSHKREVRVVKCVRFF